MNFVDADHSETQAPRPSRTSDRLALTPAFFLTRGQQREVGWVLNDPHWRAPCRKSRKGRAETTVTRQPVLATKRPRVR